MLKGVRGTRIVMNLCGKREIAIYLRTLLIDYYDSHAGLLGFILGEGGWRVFGLEILDFSKMGIRPTSRRRHAWWDRRVRMTEGTPQFLICGLQRKAIPKTV